MKTTDEMMAEFAYLGARARRRSSSTIRITSRALIDGEIRPVPAGKFPPKIEGAEETLRKHLYGARTRAVRRPAPEGNRGSDWISS